MTVMRPSIGNLLETAFWALYCIVFAYFLAGGGWVIAGGMLGTLLLVVAHRYAEKAVVMAWILGMPSAFVLVDGLIKGSGIPIITADRALMGFLVLTLVLRLLLGKERLPRLSALERWMIVLLAIVALSFLSTVPRKSGHDLYQGVVHMLEGYLTPFAGYLIARTQRWSDRDVRLLLQCLAALAVYLAAVGAAQYFFGVYYFSPTYLGVGDKTDRAVSGFGSPVEFGHVMACLTLLCLFLHTVTTDAGRRALILLAAVAAACGLALSLTRACWLGAAVALTYVFWKDRRVRGVLLSGALVAGLALAVALPLVMRTDVFEKRLTELTPIYNRLALWSTAANMIAHNPLFGVGFGYRTFNDEKREYLVSFGPSALGKYALEPGVPHNEFLHVFAMLGIVGFGAYVRVYQSAFRVARARREAPDGADEFRARLAPYVQAMFLVFFVGGMVSEMWTFRYLLTLLFFLVGVMASAPGAPPHAPAPQRG